MDKNVDSEKVNKRVMDLWEKYGPGISKLCHMKLSNYPQDAEDVTSEIYLALHNAVYDDKIKGNPKSWLYSVTRNLINKKYKEIIQRRKRYVSLNDTNYCHRLSYEIDMLEPRVSEEKIMEIKKEIEGELSPDENNLLDLIYRKKKKHRKIAKKLDTTENAVKQRNYRLKRNIKSKAHRKMKDYINSL